MARYLMLSAALLIGAPASAQDPLAPIAPEPGVLEAAPPVRGQNVQECEGERFVFAWGVGARPTRVTLCSEKGATTEEIITMLQDAAGKIDDSSLPEDRRTAIALQIRGKIAELQGKSASVLQAPARTSTPSVAPVAPPVRTAPPAPPAPVAQPQPPAASTATVAALSKPQLQLRCYDRGETGPGSPCKMLEGETRLAVTAVEALPAGTSLRFVRRGRDRAEVKLGAMAKGQSTTLALPSALCRGILQTQFEILIVRAGQVVDKAGPFRLRC
jgi:hypothetical protein